MFEKKSSIGTGVLVTPVNFVIMDVVSYSQRILFS